MRSTLRAAVLALAIVVAHAGDEDLASMPKGVRTGARLYQEHCGSCHALWGEGSGTGLDLSLAPAPTGASLCRTIWRHTPLLAPTRGSGDELSLADMEALYAFLYYVAIVDEPGDAAAGRKAIEDKGCLSCHSVAGRGGTVGPDLARWAAFGHPVVWAQMMWNHAPKMAERAKELDRKWPRLEGRDMVDIIAYVRSTATELEAAALSPGDPGAGRKVFEGKGCAGCHRADAAGKAVGPDLARPSPEVRTVSQLAGEMWNHAPEMLQEMTARGIPYPMLSPQEMADLTAYLFTLRYFDPPGNAERGRLVFERKHCVLCHEASDGSPARAPALRAGAVSPMDLARELWNHGRAMMDRMEGAKVPWPPLEQAEVIDLLEYLSSPRVASQSPGPGGKEPSSP
ncbi:MAG: c-type cytochrome [Acidobacteriota bacterium]